MAITGDELVALKEWSDLILKKGLAGLAEWGWNWYLSSSKQELLDDYNQLKTAQGVFLFASAITQYAVIRTATSRGKVYFAAHEFATSTGEDKDRARDNLLKYDREQQLYGLWKDITKTLAEIETDTQDTKANLTENNHDNQVRKYALRTVANGIDGIVNTWANYLLPTEAGLLMDLQGAHDNSAVFSPPREDQPSQRMRHPMQEEMESRSPQQEAMSSAAAAAKEDGGDSAVFSPPREDQPSQRMRHPMQEEMESRSPQQEAMPSAAAAAKEDGGEG